MKHLLVLAALVLVFLPSNPAQATIINSYDFDGSLSDSLGRGPNLTSLGGRIVGGRYYFDANQGLSLSNALASTDSYSIEIKFEVSSSLNSSWHKLIDFSNLTSDRGFYANGFPSSGPFGIQFYSDVFNGPNQFLLNSDVVVRLNRDGITDEVEGFLDGVSQWRFTDFFGNSIPTNNLLTFFVDDDFTSQREAFFGSVDYIRILDNSSAVPEPSSWIIWSLLGAAVSLRRLSSTKLVRPDSNRSNH